MTAVEFRPWSKTPRLFRDMCVTEKIDGSNAAIQIVPGAGMDLVTTRDQAPRRHLRLAVVDDLVVYAQSRNRLITPDSDNHGFAKWVEKYAWPLTEALGEGIHYGEWWGSGIQRKYGLTGDDKRFSLFNVNRYADVSIPEIGLGVVPVLYQGPFDTRAVVAVVDRLELDGSSAAPGFMRPEGVVVYHEAARSTFKVTIENDAKPKGLIP